MGSRLFLALFLFVFIQFASCSAKPALITFRTEPLGARVTLNNHYLGLSGQPVQLPALVPEAQVHLSIALTGYAPHEESLSALALLQSSQYPDASLPAIALKPTGLRAYLAPLALGAFLLALGLLVARRQRRESARVKRIEELIAQNSSDASKIARRLGGYLLVKELGGGGMARVYQGLPARGAQPVAVKVMHRDFAQDPEFQRRFQREIDLCRQLDHPNIVKLLGWGQDEAQLFLVMEYLEGGTLSRRIKPGGHGPEEALELLTPLFDAIAYAHARGVVHRDLKPDNVMLTADGQLKVTDLGLGREFTSDLTETGTALGTPAYMAPEQIRGVGFEPASDQYALGIMAYEILSGRRPFEHTDPIQLIFLQVSREAPPLTGDLPDEVAAAVMRMLAKQPEERFPSVEAAGRALLGALRDWARSPRR